MKSLTRFKSILAIMLALAMALALVPASALAEETTTSTTTTTETTPPATTTTETTTPTTTTTETTTPGSAEGTPKPEGDTTKPAEDTPKPAEDTPKPTEGTPKPVGDTPKPVGDTPKPATACATCGGTTAAHQDVCSLCKQCGGTHASGCANTPCDKCGGTLGAHLNVCSVCKQCDSSHKAGCFNAPCSKCSGTLGKHEAGCPTTVLDEEVVTTDVRSTVTKAKAEDFNGESVQNEALGGDIPETDEGVEKKEVTNAGENSENTEFVSPKINITATISWTNRPAGAKAIVYLLRNGAIVDAEQTNASSYTFTDLDEYSDENTRYQYRIAGEAVGTDKDKAIVTTNGTTKVSVSYPDPEPEPAPKLAAAFSLAPPQTENIDVTGSIAWPDALPEGANPTLTITLSGTELSTTKGKGDTSYTITAPKYDSENQEITYTVSPSVTDSLEGYTVSATASGNVVTVTYEAIVVGTTSVAGMVVWTGLASEATSTVVVTLLRDGVAIDSKSFTGNSMSQFTFSDLPDRDAKTGTGYTYSLSATASEVTGYQLNLPTPAYNVRSNRYTISPIYSMNDDVLTAYLAELAKRFTTLINALPTAEELAQLRTSGSDAFNTYAAFYTEAVAIRMNLDKAKREGLDNLIDASVMEKYNALAGSFPKTRAFSSSDVKMTIAFQYSTTTKTVPATTFTLKRKVNGTEDSSFSKTVNMAAQTAAAWSYNFGKQDDARESDSAPYTYYIDWPGIIDYTKSTSQLSAVYRAEAAAATKSITVIVTWAEEADQASRPAAGVDISINGTSKGKITATDSWKKTYTGLSGDIVVTAETIADYNAPTVSISSDGLTYTVKYQYNKNMAPYDIVGTINWHDSTARTQAITVTLYQWDLNGKHLYATATLPANDNTYRFTVPQYSAVDHVAFRYSVEGSSISGYTWDANYTSSIDYWPGATTDHVHLSVNVNWDDSQDKRGLRPIETTVYLYKNGVFIDEKQVRAVDGWKTAFFELETCRRDTNNKIIETFDYTIRAAKISSYYAHAVHRGSNTSVTLTYHYGTGSYGGTTTASNSYVPRLGDALVYNAGELSDAQVTRLEKEDARALGKYEELAKTVRTGDSVDFSTLEDINKQTVAWLSNGKDIDYPVLRGGTINFYLNRLYNRERNHVGSLTMDPGCSKDIKSRNTVIYGRNMGNKSMFGTLSEYAKQSYYDANPTMRLFTPNGNYTIELFAGLTTSDVFNNASLARIKFDSDETFMNLVDSCIKRSDFTSSVEVKPGDSIITLVTSSYDYDGAYYLVMGRLAKAK